MATAVRTGRIGRLAAAGVLVVLMLVASGGPARAEQERVVAARVVRTSGSSIVLQPLVGDKDMLVLWDRKIPVAKDAVAVMPDGTVTKVSKIKAGSLVTARITGEVRTTTISIGCGILINGKYGCGVLAVPRKSTFLDGNVSDVRVLDGRCVTKKNVRLGGGGEQTTVVLCRYSEDGEGFYSVAVNASKADHAADVVAALTAGEVRISRSGSGGPPLTARFVSQGEMALASVRSTEAKDQVRVDVAIYANGPHDGLDMTVYKVASSTKL